MKLNLFGVFTLCFLAFSLLSCSDDDEKKIFDFKLDTASGWEVTQARTRAFRIESGNGDYTFRMKEEGIIMVTFSADYSGFGAIEVTGRKTGETVLSITDNVTETTIEVHVKVTDNYLEYSILESEHPGLIKELRVYLINNENKDAYFFDGGKKVAKGSYDFALQDGVRYMKLWYADNGNGAITDAAIAWTEHLFDIEKK
ncbi:MAG: hypothetical protein LUE93_03660 [Bacteroides sp.]|nr:hypothetical protein [Bacteroides sp.]